MLDEVRAIKSARNNMSATISIGVGRGAKDIAESERWARQALDMALGRGGDQVGRQAGGGTPTNSSAVFPRAWRSGTRSAPGSSPPPCPTM